MLSLLIAAIARSELVIEDISNITMSYKYPDGLSEENRKEELAKLNDRFKSKEYDLLADLQSKFQKTELETNPNPDEINFPEIQKQIQGLMNLAEKFLIKNENEI